MKWTNDLQAFQVLNLLKYVILVTFVQNSVVISVFPGQKSLKVGGADSIY